jgi:hypothetical protein
MARQHKLINNKVALGTNIKILASFCIVNVLFNKYRHYVPRNHDIPDT